MEVDLFPYFHEYILGYPDVNKCGICQKPMMAHRTKNQEIIHLHRKVQKIDKQLHRLVAVVTHAIATCPACQGAATIQSETEVDYVWGVDPSVGLLPTEIITRESCPYCTPLREMLEQIAAEG